MIWGRWQDPNFKFRAVDREGVSYSCVCYSASEEALRRRLAGMGLTVERIEPYDFKDWKDRAAAATEKAVQAYRQGRRPIKFNRAIWAELKWHLFELFNGKCAYCETRPLPGAYGDVEHFRPKSKVDEDRGHPGYYWLAYEATNLLPSCEPCNRALAKMTHFPVAEAHAREPTAMGGEQPLLLNPWNREIDPLEHLEFGPLGEVTARAGSARGEKSRTHYHLNRPGLVEARFTALARVERDWLAMAGILSSLQRHVTLDVLRQEIRTGTREYSAAQWWHLERIAAREQVPPR